MKTVIRIEHPEDGYGLWCSTDENEMIPRLSQHSCFWDIVERHKLVNGFPNYKRDTELNEQIDAENIKNYSFAFKSLEQLKTALTEKELKECIIKLGFRVLMLDVTDYFESKYQIAFNKNSIVNSKDITFMFI